MSTYTSIKLKWTSIKSTATKFEKVDLFKLPTISFKFILIERKGILHIYVITFIVLKILYKTKTKNHLFSNDIYNVYSY